MDIFDTGANIDSAKLIEYITTQFPGELKTLIETKDELAKRQGALSAVDAAVADRAAAKTILEEAKATAKGLLDDAKAKNAAAKAKLAEFDQKVFAFNAEVDEKNAALFVREKNASTVEAVQAGQGENLRKQEANLNEREAALQANEQALQDRIKAFQDKVASLTA
jgi:chromosome segregation ATPase